MDFGLSEVALATHGASGELILEFVVGGTVVIENHFSGGAEVVVPVEPVSPDPSVEWLVMRDTAYLISDDPSFTSGTLEDLLGPPCAPVELTITSPSTISGLFEACHSVTASGVQVIDSGATFRAGTFIALGDGFSVASGASFTAEIDPLLLP